MDDRELIEALHDLRQDYYGGSMCVRDRCALFKEAADRLEALASLPVRDGWRAAPPRADNAMQIAGLKPLLAYLNDDTDTYRAEDLIDHIWLAMLSAAPPESKLQKMQTAPKP